MSTSREKMRVYNRRSKMGSASGSDNQADTRDWASLPPKLLEKVFLSLEVADLQSAKETCRKWKAQVLGDPTQVPAVSSWTDTIDTILQHLHQLNQEKEADVDVMMQFLVQEGIMKAP